MRYYTLIGSRETPEHILNMLTKVSRKLCEAGWIVRSGGANGADQCAEDGHIYGELQNANIYLPWDGFNDKWSSQRGYINTPKLSTYPEAQHIASELHPKWKIDKQIEAGEIEKPKNWKPMKRGAKALHTRNVYQILGNNLDTPSRFVLCWALPLDNKGNVKGGTGQAVRLALQHDVEVINLYHQEHLDRILNWLEG